MSKTILIASALAAVSCGGAKTQVEAPSPFAKCRDCDRTIALSQSLSVMTSWSALCEIEPGFEAAYSMGDNTEPNIQECNGRRYKAEARCEGLPCKVEVSPGDISIYPQSTGTLAVTVVLTPERGKPATFHLPPVKVVKATNVVARDCTTLQPGTAEVFVDVYADAAPIGLSIDKVSVSGGQRCIHSVNMLRGETYICRLPTSASRDLDVEVETPAGTFRTTATCAPLSTQEAAR